MSINRYLYISLYYYYKVSSGAPEPGPRLNQTIQDHLSPCTGPTGQDISDYKQDLFLLHKNSYQGGDPPGPLEERGKETMARPRLGEQERRTRTVDGRGRDRTKAGEAGVPLLAELGQG